MGDSAHRYTTGEYGAAIPDWHESDAEWKAEHVARALDRVGLEPRTVCDIGCGTGGVLDHLADRVPSLDTLVGFEISRAAIERAPTTRRGRIELVLDPSADDRTFDVALMLDVLEHVDDYQALLRTSRHRAQHFVFHVPLDRTVLNTLRRGQYGRLRVHSGHLHYFTRATALSALADAGYRVLDDQLTSGGIERATTSRQRLMAIPRRLTRWISPAAAARTIGGFSLLVVAEGGAQASR